MAHSTVVHCPQCKTALKIGTARPGTIKCTCPKCGGQFEVTLRAPNTVMPPKVSDTGLGSGLPLPAEKLTKTKLEPTAKSQESPLADKVVKTKLEMPAPAKSQKTGENTPLAEPPNATRPPLRRVSNKRIPARWLLAGGVAIVLVGIMSICVIGVGWFLVFRQSPLEFPTTLKPGQLSREEFDARALIIPFEKIGPPKRLYEIEMVQIKGKAKFFDQSNDSVFLISSESLKRVKFDEVGENESNVILIGNHGLSVKNKETETLKKERLKYYQNFNHAVVLSYLIVLTEKGSDVTSGETEDVLLGDKKKKCATAIVNRSGRPPMKLFFDKESKFLVKLEFTGTVLDANDKPLPNTFVEFFFDKYEPTNGVYHWKKLEQKRNGTKYSEIVVSEVTFFDKVDDTFFSFNNKAIDDQVANLVDDDKKRNIAILLAEHTRLGDSDFTRLVTGLNANQAKPELRSQFKAALLDYVDLLEKNKVVRLNKTDVNALVTLLKADDPVELQSFASEQVLLLEPNRLELNQLADLMQQPNMNNRAIARVNLLNRLLERRVSSKDLAALQKGLRNFTDRDLLLAFIDATGSLEEKAADAVPELIPHLKSGGEVSDKAARALHNMKKLIEVVSDKKSDAGVLLPGLEYLKKNAITKDGAIKAYRQNLGHSNDGVKDTAALALLILAPEEFPLGNELMALADRPDQKVGQPARDLLLIRLANATAKDIPTLRQGLKKNVDPKLLKAFIDAVDSLKREEASKAVPELTALLKSKTAGITERAAIVLHKMEKLIDIVAAEDSDAGVLVPGLEYLRKKEVKTLEARKAYKKCRGHSDVNVQDTATLALLELGPEDLNLKEVLDLTKVPNKEVYAAAAKKVLYKKLESVAKKDVVVIRMGLECSVPEIRLAFIDSAGFLKADGHELVPDLTSLLGSTDKEVSARAIRALDRMEKLIDVVDKYTEATILLPVIEDLKTRGVKSKEALLVYKKRLDNKDSRVTDAASLALLNLGPEEVTLEQVIAWTGNEKIRVPAKKLVDQRLDNVTIKDLLVLRNGLKIDTPQEVRLSLIDVIGKFGKVNKKDIQEAVPDLSDLLDTSDSVVSIKAIGVLKSMGKDGKRAVKQLEKTVMKSKEMSVKVAAAQALSKIDPLCDVLAAKGEGIKVLVEDVKPVINDLEDLKAFLARPAGNDESAASLIEIGAPAVNSVYNHLLRENSLLHPEKKTAISNRDIQPTASRYVGYKMLKEFAKKANDPSLTKALKVLQPMLLKNQGEDAALSKEASMRMIPDEVKQLHAETAKASKQAFDSIKVLP
jgi:hypothetical protein